MTDAVRTHLASRSEEILALMRDLVAIGSHAADPAGVRRVASRVQEELHPIGFEFSETPAPALGDDLLWLEQIMSPGVPYDRLAPSYVAHRPGSGDRRVLLLGDLDTAFPGTGDDLPFRIDGNLALGPGIADMQAGVAVMVAALTALDATGTPVPPITIVLSGDEQAGSLGSRRLIEEAAVGAAVCLCMECARLGGKLMGSRGHIGVGRLVATGKESHTGSAHRHGVNALDALARAVPQCNEVTNPEAGVYVTVTMAEAGRRRSVMPASASAVVDVRTPDAEAWARTEERLREIVDAVDRGHEADIELRLYCHRPGVPWTNDTDRLLELASDVAAPLGIEISAIRSAAAGSTAFVAAAGVPVLDGLGPLGGGIMTDEEYVEVDSLAPRTALLAGLIARFAS